MPITITLPQLGLTMTEGTITEWAKQPGERVMKGDILFYVENDKAVVPYESSQEGILGQILVPAMKTVPTGTPVAVLLQEGESLEAIQKEPAQKESAQQPQEVAPAVPKAEVITEKAEQKSEKTTRAPELKFQEKIEFAPPHADSFILASPYARVLAKEHTISLAGLQGTGPAGAIIAHDILKEAQKNQTVSAGTVQNAQSTQLSPGYHDQPLGRIQQIAAQRLTQSWQEIPQFTLSIQAQAQKLQEAQSAFQNEGDKISITALLAKLSAAAIREYPMLNAAWLGNGMVRVYEEINIGIAVDSPDGLVVPVIRDCGHKGLKQIAQELSMYAEASRSKTVSPEVLQGGTITISNLGMFGITRFRAIINPPQCAILSIGAMVRMPVEGSNGICFMPFMEIGLTADHRIIDGAYGARFLAKLKALIENPLLALG